MNENDIITCLKCNKTFTCTSSLQLHVKKFHSCDNKRPKKHFCVECKRCLSNFFSLKRHVKKYHPTKINEIKDVNKKNRSNSYKFTCTCGKNFSYNHHFQYHKRTCHNDTEKKKTKKCPICNYLGSDKPEMLNHFKDAHKIIIKTQELQFFSFEKFKEWKIQLEAETYSWFIRNSTTSVKKLEKTYYYCHRSGNYKTQGRGLRKLKIQGSKKINGYCPAGISLSKYKSGHCTVLLTETHVGHENEVEHTQLTQTERNFLAKKISMKVPLNSILTDIRDKQSNKLKRIDLLLKKDLFNIRNSLRTRCGGVECVTGEKIVDEDEDDINENDIKKKKTDICHISNFKEGNNGNLEVYKTFCRRAPCKCNTDSDFQNVQLCKDLCDIYLCNKELSDLSPSLKNKEQCLNISEETENTVFSGDCLKNANNAQADNNVNTELENNVLFDGLVNNISTEQLSSQEFYKTITETDTNINNYNELFEDLVTNMCSETLDNKNLKRNIDNNESVLIADIADNNLLMDTELILNQLNLNTVTQSELILNELNPDVVNSIDEEKKYILETFSEQLGKVDSSTKLRIVRTVVESLSFILNAGEKSNCLDFSLIL